MAFNFGGTPSSSGAASGGLFGSAGANNTPSGGSLFGGNTGNTGTGPSLFGGGGSSNNAAGGGVFGGQSTEGGNAFSFGQSKPDGNNSSTPPTFSFGTPAKTPSTSAAGSTTPAPSNLFGGLSTTPAGPPPSSVGLGASTGGSLFGASNQTASENVSKPASFSFGNAAGASAATSNTPAPGSGGAFFQAQPAASSAAPASSTPSFSFGASKSSEPPSAAAAPMGQSNLFGKAGPASGTQQSPNVFGAKPASAAGTPNLFGAASSTSPTPSSQPQSQPASGGFFSKPASSTPNDASAKPAFSFPTPTASAPSESAPKPAFSFGQVQQAQSSTPTTSGEAAKGGLFGGAPSTAPATSASPFGSQPVSGATPAATTSAASAGTSAPAPSAFSFPPKSTASTEPAAPANSFGSNTKVGFAGTQTTAPAFGNTQAGAKTSAGAAASTSGPVPPPQSRLKNKTMDEILTRWATDLTTYTQEFRTHAETLAKWDQKIVDNSSKIDKLYVKTRTCEKQTMSVEMQLTAVENQQAELEAWLSKYETDVDEMLAKESSNPADVGGPDQEREKTYKLAEKLSERLDEMDSDLQSMVEEVNAANAGLSKTGKADEPITQIVKILNTHLNQLQAIDQGASILQSKVAEARKAARGIGYMNGPAGNEGTGPAGDFYRSYMGRR